MVFSISDVLVGYHERAVIRVRTNFSKNYINIRSLNTPWFISIGRLFAEIQINQSFLNLSPVNL